MTDSRREHVQMDESVRRENGGCLKACFFDRDGVLIEEENYLSDPARVRLCAGAAESIRLMRLHGFKIIIVSNQSGIARGYFTEDDLKRVELRLDELLAAENASVDARYYCFHHPKGIIPEYTRECDCRKPAPGMLLTAAAEWNLDLTQSVMFGDKTSDVEAGLRAGCRIAGLVRTGHGGEQKLDGYPPEKVIDAPDILSAVRMVLGKLDRG